MIDGCSLIITLIGKVNSGKSLICNALFNKNLADVSSIPGWTKEVKLYEIEKNIYIADTPGIEDVDQEVAHKTFDFIGKTDIFLHIVNADEGITKIVKKCHERIIATGKPVCLVVNKTDHFTEDEKVQIKSHTKEILKPEDLILISAKTKDGIDKLKNWIHKVLEERGEELKMGKNKFIMVKCPNCHMVFDDENLIVDIGFFFITYTCPYCHYSEKKFYWSLSDAPDWTDEETEAITEANFDRILEEEGEDVDSN